MITSSAVVLLRLPHGKIAQAFKQADFLSFGLFAGGLALFAAVIGEGRFLWWTDTPWLGRVLCASIPPLVAAIVIEYHRRRPLIATRWLGGADILRFLLMAILVRVVQSEQPSGAVALLNTLGFDNDQFHSLFWNATAATLAGSIASAALIRVNRLTHQIILALTLAAIGAGMVAASRTDQQVVAVKSQCEALTQALRIATNRYRAGYSPYLDQLDAQRGLLDAELGLIQAQAARLSAYVDLYRALGGGWRTAQVTDASPRG